MKSYQYFSDALSALVWVGQLGLDLLMPPVLCVGLCWLLVTHLGVGGWVYVPGFVLGIGGGVASAKRFWQVTRKKTETTKVNHAFNTHE